MHRLGQDEQAERLRLGTFTGGAREHKRNCAAWDKGPFEAKRFSAHGTRGTMASVGKRDTNKCGRAVRTGRGGGVGDEPYRFHRRRRLFVLRGQGLAVTAPREGDGGIHMEEGGRSRA